MSEVERILGCTLVVAPHPDDEVLGAGGTIARLTAAGCEVVVAIVTTGRPPAYTAETVANVRAEAEAAHSLLGVSRTAWLDQPAAGLAETPTATLNAVILDIVRDVAPRTLLLPFAGDIHVDHQLVFRSALVAARPHQQVFPRTVLAYETLSESNWNAPYLTPGFHPNVYVDITGYLESKLEAMSRYGSQVKPPPHERSLDTLRALAVLRGAAVHCPAAEAFVMVRHVL